MQIEITNIAGTAQKEVALGADEGADILLLPPKKRRDGHRLGQFIESSRDTDRADHTHPPFTQSAK